MGSPSVKVKTYLRRQKEGPAIRKMLRMTEKRAMDATRVFFLLEERGEGGGGRLMDEHLTILLVRNLCLHSSCAIGDPSYYGATSTSK